MFSNDSYAKIKKIVKKEENYTVCQISISKKTKKTNTYECDFTSYVKFIGEAHKLSPLGGQKIQILSCGVSNCYSDNGMLKFLKQPNYVIFDYALVSDEENNKTEKEKTVAPMPIENTGNDWELPF